MTETLFLDCEFTGLYQTSDLISLALVGHERSFYAEFTDFEKVDLADWHRAHILPNLLFTGLQTFSDNEGPNWRVKGDSAFISQQLRSFFQSFPHIEIWGDVPHYDWVLFCELFGGARSLPNMLHYIPGDLATLLRLRDIDPDIRREDLLSETDLIDLKKQGLQKHNALWDAHLMYLIYQKMRKDE